MSQKMKDGKLVIDSETDKYFAAVMESNPFSAKRDASLYDVPPAIQKELKAKGLEWRWIDSKEYQANGNQHKNYWVPYRRTEVSSMESDTFEFKGGISADGYIRRKGSVLAVRPKQLGDKHRAMIEEKTRRQAQVAATEEQRFHEEAKRAGFKPKFLEEE